MGWTTCQTHGCKHSLLLSVNPMGDTSRQPHGGFPLSNLLVTPMGGTQCQPHAVTSFFVIFSQPHGWYKSSTPWGFSIVWLLLLTPMGSTQCQPGDEFLCHFQSTPWVIRIVHPMGMQASNLYVNAINVTLGRRKFRVLIVIGVGWLTIGFG